MKEARILKDKMDNMVNVGNLKPPETLKEYCPWLATFQGCDFDQEVEIPGRAPGSQSTREVGSVGCNSNDGTQIR